MAYVLAKPHWGRGYAPEAATLCLDYGFRQLLLDHVAAVAVPENGASLRVMEKLGFAFLEAARFYEMSVRYHRIERDNWAAQEQRNERIND